MSAPVILNPLSKGKVIDIQGLKIQLPKQPSKSLILYSDKPKKDQRWVREEMPKGLTRENAADYYEYIEQELRS